MKRSLDRVLVTHTGSLPRPADLLPLLLAADAGEAVDELALELRVRSAVAEAVALQVEAGIDIVSDGEMGKVGFVNYLSRRLEGFGGASPTFRPADLADYPELGDRRAGPRPNRPACNGPVTYRDTRAPARDARTLREAASSHAVAEMFIASASPATVAQVMGNEHYKTRRDYLYALAGALRHEYRTIVESGVILQVDCPDLAMGRHVDFADASIDAFRKVLAENVEVLNHALVGLPADRIRVHVCWGNYLGPHHRDVAFADIVDLVLAIHGGAFSIEAANPRHAHEWAVFETTRLPDGALLIPGVIDSKTNYIEHPALVAERLVRFARLVGRENVMAGTDCGFGTFATTAMVEPRIAYAKLAALAEGARQATRVLWPA